jgi:hypothetical protein
MNWDLTPWSSAASPKLSRSVIETFFYILCKRASLGRAFISSGTMFFIKNRLLESSMIPAKAFEQCELIFLLLLLNCNGHPWHERRQLMRDSKLRLPLFPSETFIVSLFHLWLFSMQQFRWVFRYNYHLFYSSVVKVMHCHCLAMSSTHMWSQTRSCINFKHITLQAAYLIGFIFIQLYIQSSNLYINWFKNRPLDVTRPVFHCGDAVKTYCRIIGVTYVQVPQSAQKPTSLRLLLFKRVWRKCKVFFKYEITGFRYTLKQKLEWQKFPENKKGTLCQR